MPDYIFSFFVSAVLALFTLLTLSTEPMMGVVFLVFVFVFLCIGMYQMHLEDSR
jgi:hypothetical protein